MDILIEVALPLSLAIIMLSLGLGLGFEDFARVARRSRAFLIGALAQIIILPVIAFCALQLVALPPELAVGVMLLSFCPGGVTSNILSKLAKGDVALSVSLTAVISLLSILTVPLLTAWAVSHFMSADAPDVNITSLAIAMFLITTLPVLIGVLVRQTAPSFATRIEPGFARLATGLFVLLVVAALATNWQLFMDNFAVLGGILVGLNILLLAVGYGISATAGLTPKERKTVAIEAGIQNSALGITLGGLVAVSTDGFSAFALPAGVYGITMYAVALPFILWARGR
ncbi:MAG: bile acid:sodium symporter family protein [Pseudomonadota bacterium]